MSQRELADLARKAKRLETKIEKEGPQDREQLHAWILGNLGLDIPRTAVCEHHDAPFDFLADIYFEDVESVLLMANRGGNKTAGVAIVHILNCLFKPGCESGTLGAIEMQAQRAYEHFQRYIRDPKTGQFISEIQGSTITQTTCKNGSKLEVRPATLNSVNGPHWQKVHFDEVELADPIVYQESRNISTSKQMPDGRIYRAQDIITSTRKHAKGMMQDLINEIENAERQGFRPPYKLYQWCIWECAKQVPNCRGAMSNVLPEEELCECNKIVQGTWDAEGTPRTLEDVCKGRLYKSRGWKPYEDIVNTFTKSSRGIWEAQQECSRPSTEYLYVPEFSKDTHGIKHYEPDPELGPIFMSVDFGGTNPHAVNWYQLLRYEVEVMTYTNKVKRLKEGTLVCFDEIYIAEIGNMKLADKIVEKELKYKRLWPKWRVFKRFADPQAKAARLDFAQTKHKLITAWFATREFEEHVKLVRVLVDEDLFYVDVLRCPMFCEEVEVWRRDVKNEEKQVDEFNHCMSNWRYAVANINRIEMANRRLRSSPISINRPEVKRNYSSNPQIPMSASNRRDLPPGEEWRADFKSTR